MSRSLEFVKMEGAGNDYVYIDGIRQQVSIEAAGALAIPLAERHFGIGGDGLILLASSAVADCRMVMWNADGSRGAMCGNGLRCLARLAHDEGHVAGLDMQVETDSGVLPVTLIERDGEIVGARVPMTGARADAEATQVEVEGRRWPLHLGDAGNPHAVLFVDGSLDRAPVESLGAALQSHPLFPDGVNVEFIHVEGPSRISQRTFERGSAETLACGTGATVAAIAAARSGRASGPVITVALLGGELRIDVDAPEPVMEGPARVVFRGAIEIS